MSSFENWTSERTDLEVTPVAEEKPTSWNNEFTCGAAAKAYVLAGRARVTLVSKRTGTRFTYKISGEEGRPHFVSVLTDADNTSGYSFLGSIFESAKYFHGRKSRIGREAPSAKAWSWAWGYLVRGVLPPECEVWHEGVCGKCGRVLTVPESLASGFGPVCEGRIAA